MWGKVSNKWCESMCVYLCVPHVFASQQGILSSWTHPAQLSSHRSREEGYRSDPKNRGSQKHSGGLLMITQHRSKLQTGTNLCCPSIPRHTRAHIHILSYHLLQDQQTNRLYFTAIVQTQDIEWAAFEEKWLFCLGFRVQRDVIVDSRLLT